MTTTRLARDGQWYYDDNGNKVVHHGNYLKTDDQGQSIAMCGARSHISPIDGIVMTPDAKQVTCARCIALIEKRVDRAIAGDPSAHGFTRGRRR